MGQLKNRPGLFRSRRDGVAISFSGEDKLVRELELIAGLRFSGAKDNAKSLKGAMRGLTRDACKTIVLPDAKSAVPVDEGSLEDNLTVRAIGRSRTKVGHTVTLRDPLFQGDTFYGGFIEFGFNHWRAGKIEADSFLRRALYTNEARVRNHIATGFKTFVKKKNRLVGRL